MRRLRTWRLENAEAEVYDWERELDRARRSCGAASTRALECRRCIARYERRVARLRRKLGIADA